MFGRGKWFLPLIVVAVGAYALIATSRSGALQPVALAPVQIAGLAAVAAGLIASVVGGMKQKPVAQLIGVLVCGVGAILVICL